MPAPGRRVVPRAGAVLLTLLLPGFVAVPRVLGGPGAETGTAGAGSGIAVQPADPAEVQLVVSNEADGSTPPQKVFTLWEPGQDSEALTAPRADYWDRVRDDVDLSREDFRHFYSTNNLLGVALGVAVAAPIANTAADRHLSHWYQENVRTKTTDAFATAMNYGGQLWVVLPIGLEAAAVMGKAPDEYYLDSSWYEWSNRSLRALTVGFPTVLPLYVVLGASRPDRDDSRWRPFHDVHGVSGHTFMAAVPFLTAAEMTDNVWLQAPLVAGSFAMGWSRINDNRHYLSQVMLGWWLAYLATKSVDETQAGRRSLSIVPFTGDGPGLGVQWKF